MSGQEELLYLLKDLRGRPGLSMVIITHNLNIMRHLADRMGPFYLGCLLEEATTEVIFSQPRHPYTNCLLSANPEPDPDARLARVALKGEPPSLINRPYGYEFRDRCPVASAICTQVPKFEVTDSHAVRCLTPLHL